EFENTRASGFTRLVSPFWLAVKHFDSGSLQALFVGSGPGTAKTFGDILTSATFGTGNLATWFKLFYEYGIFGSFIFCCFLAFCLRRSRCPGLMIGAIIVAYVFLQGSMIIAIALCTLSGRGPRLASSDETSLHRSSLVARARTV